MTSLFINCYLHVYILLYIHSYILLTVNQSFCIANKYGFRTGYLIMDIQLVCSSLGSESSIKR